MPSIGIGQPKDARVRQARGIKKLLKARWLTTEEFARSCRGETVGPTTQPEESMRTTSRNQIDRITNTAGGPSGSLYDFFEYCHASVDIYWRIADGYEDMVREFLEDLQVTGYGKRKTVGYGEVGDFTFGPYDGFPSVVNSNAFVSLSCFVPAMSDPQEGYWTVKVKYGKLGEERATGSHPFKRPLVQLEAGACFLDPAVREWYGRLITGLSVDSGVVQYGYAFPVSMHLVK